MAARSGYQKLGKQWEGMSPLTVAFTADATGIGGQLVFTTNQTILRVIGEYVIQATSAPAALDAAEITVGLGLFPRDAFDLGATAMPDPGNEADYPWLFWASHSMRWNSTTVQDDDGSGYLRRLVDIRSMRKVKPRETLGWVFQYSDGGGAPPVNVGNSRCRVLVGLH